MQRKVVEVSAPYLFGQQGTVAATTITAHVTDTSTLFTPSLLELWITAVRSRGIRKNVPEPLLCPTVAVALPIYRLLQLT